MPMQQVSIAVAAVEFMNEEPPESDPNVLASAEVSIESYLPSTQRAVLSGRSMVAR